jgi:hypothetical protein
MMVERPIVGEQSEIHVPKLVLSVVEVSEIEGGG